MPTLLNHTYPYYRILRADGSYAVFQAGRLDIEPDDPDYGTIMDIAANTPSITVLSTEVVADGSKRTRRVKEPDRFACDAGHPVQVFEDEESLTIHNQTFHLAKPELDDEGKTVGTE